MFTSSIYQEPLQGVLLEEVLLEGMLLQEPLL